MILEINAIVDQKARLERICQAQKPVICIPIIGVTENEIFHQIDSILMHEPDLIEWRVDYYEHIFHTELVLSMLERIREITQLPILFTCRSPHEGGNDIEFTTERLIQLLQAVCEQSLVEYIDFEVSKRDSEIEEVRSIAERYNKTFVLSYHNFQMTPDESAILTLAKRAESAGAHVFKFALMPNEQDDVLRLLEMTRKIDLQCNLSVISMSMGELGKLSRLVGWMYGSILSFGAGIKISAPGQMPVADLKSAIALMKKNVPEWK